MPDYSKSKIYEIVDDSTGKRYIGATCEPSLAQRLASHVSAYKKYKAGKHHYVTSFKILENNSYHINLLESYPCTNKDELNAKERKWIESTECVNKHIPGRTTKEFFKQYYVKNKDKILAQQKENYRKNKDKICKRVKKYRDEHKDKLFEKHACECGGRYTTINKPVHRRSARHRKHFEKTQKAWIEEQKEKNELYIQFLENIKNKYF